MPEKSIANTSVGAQEFRMQYGQYLFDIEFHDVEGKLLNEKRKHQHKQYLKFIILRCLLNQQKKQVLQSNILKKRCDFGRLHNAQIRFSN